MYVVENTKISYLLHGILGAMLHAWRHPHTGELRLYVRGVTSEAWISPQASEAYPAPSGRHGSDWVLWVWRGQALTLENCPQRLEVQSLLRA